MKKKKLFAYADWEGNFHLFNEKDEADPEQAILIDHDEVESKQEGVVFFQRAREHYLREAAEFGLSLKALWRLKFLERENRQLKSKVTRLENDLLSATGRAR